MNLLYPRFTLRQFGWMLVFGLVGSLIAGAYGIVHDQITFSLGPEYFTRFKFIQFPYLDFSYPVRITVMKIGFLATWWVGLFAGWFMGRVTLPHEPVKQAAKRSALGVAFMMLTALVFALVAAARAPRSMTEDLMIEWQQMMAEFQIQNALAFIRVGDIHYASYLGGLVGLIGALVWLRLTRPKLG